MTDPNPITINDIIQVQIDDRIEAQPTPTKATVTYVYEDGHVDINTKDYGKLQYIESITSHEVDDKTILIFLNGTFDEKMVI